MSSSGCNESSHYAARRAASLALLKLSTDEGMPQLEVNRQHLRPLWSSCSDTLLVRLKQSVSCGCSHGNSFDKSLLVARARCVAEPR